MYSLTASILISLPFRTNVKEGDIYEPIEIALTNGGKVIMFPLESIKPISVGYKGHYVNDFRNVSMSITLPFNEIVNFSERASLQIFLDSADKYLNLFLEHCKARSKQFWWHHIYLNDFNLKQIFYELKIINNDTQEVVYEEKGSTGGIGPVGIGIDEGIWKNIKNDMICQVKPSIVDYYLEEARDAIFAKNIDLVVVNTAIAVEICVSRFCQEYARKTNRENDSKFIYLLGARDGFVVKYFQKIIPFLASKQLSLEDNNSYRDIDYMFRARNKIVHTGEAYYLDDANIKWIVDYKKAHEFFLAADRVLHWLRALDATIVEKLKNC